MNSDSVQDYIERAEEVLKASPQMDEANTKAAVLQDFLNLLDWQIPQNTQLEYSVKAFGQTYKVDYALILDGTPVAFLEAKGADTALTDDHEDQLSSYMTNKNVTYGILTNGKQYRFFQRRVDASNVDVQKVGNVALENLPNRLAVLKAYEKDAIESGESGKILGRINELREARRTLETNKDDLAVELSNTLANGVSESISSLAETQAKEMIDRLIEDINSEIDADATQSRPDADHSISEQGSATDFSDIEGKYIVELKDRHNGLALFDGDNQSEVMAEVVNHLIQNHDLISKINPLPYIPGREKAIINDNPTSPHDDQAMRHFQELVQGYYLDTHMDKKTKKRHIRGVADKCELDVVFSGEW